MNTRCQIHFTFEGIIEANIYCDKDCSPVEIISNLRNFHKTVPVPTSPSCPISKARAFKSWCEDNNLWHEKNTLATGRNTKDQYELDYIYTIDCSPIGQITYYPIITYKDRLQQGIERPSRAVTEMKKWYELKNIENN